LASGACVAELVSVAVLRKHLPASAPIISWDEIVGIDAEVIGRLTANQRELLQVVAWLLGRIATRPSVASE